MSGVLFAVETVLLKSSARRAAVAAAPPVAAQQAAAAPEANSPPPADAAPAAPHLTLYSIDASGARAPVDAAASDVSMPVPGALPTPEPAAVPLTPVPPHGGGGGGAPVEDDEDGIQMAAVLVACVFAAMVSTAGLGSEPAFRVPDAVSFQLPELPLGVAVGVVCGGTAAVLAAAGRAAERAFVELRGAGVPAAAMPVLGGLACGCLALLRPEITYQGFENVNALLEPPDAPVRLAAAGGLAALVGVKVTATAVCKGSGLVGGLYAPSIFIGASVGVAFWTVAAGLGGGALEWLQAALGGPAGPALSGSDTYALIGAAAMLAAACRVPLTSVLLLFELTQDYTIIVPTLATVGFARWSSSAAGRYLR